MSHNVSQTAFRIGKIHPWFNSELAFINSVFWNKFKSYAVSLSIQKNPVSGLKVWYVIYYPIQFLWSLVGYPLRYKRRMFRWMMHVFKNHSVENYNAVFRFIFKLFRFQYKARHPIFLSIGKFGYANKSVRFRVKRILNQSRVFTHRKFMETDLRFIHSKKITERLGTLFHLRSFFRNKPLLEKEYAEGRVHRQLLREFKRPWFSKFWSKILKPPFNFYRLRFFSLWKPVPRKILKRIYWIWLRALQIGERRWTDRVQFMWIRYMRPQMFKYRWTKRPDSRALSYLMLRNKRGFSFKQRTRKARRLFKIRGRRRFIVRKHRNLKKIRRIVTVANFAKLSLKSRFNFWRKWKANQLFLGSKDVGYFFNLQFNLKTMNVFKYLSLKPSFYWKAKWKKLFWDQRFWRERRQYPAYFDLINVLVLQAYFRNLGFLFLKVVCLILHKFNLKRGIVLFWFFNFLNTLLKDLAQIQSVYSVFTMVFTGKVKGGTFRTSQLKAGFGDVVRQSLHKNLQFYFSEFEAFSGLFGIKLLTQRRI